MAIPSPGVPISLDTLNTEFGGGYSLSSYYRGGTYVPDSPQNTAIPASGTIALGNFYGSSNRMIVSLTASGNNYDVYTNRGASYQAGKTDLTVTVPGTIGSTSTGAYAMLVPSAFSPTDTVTIVNNGVIQGMGGSGGKGGTPTFPAPGSSSKPGQPGFGGGNALYVNRPVIITNNGTIASGGGGGGGGGGLQINSNPRPKKLGGPNPSSTAIGGGGGGGAGTNGGAGGTPNGGAGLTNSGGAAGASSPFPSSQNAPGGAGGGRGAAGSAAPASPNGGTPGAGGATGSYIVGNAFVTWPATGTRQGNVS